MIDVLMFISYFCIKYYNLCFMYYRHIYYLTLKNRLLLGHYAVTSQERIKLFGLIAQAELGDADQALPTQYHTILPDLR